MAWQTPKTDWKAGDVPAASDFNRIEGNTLYSKDEVDTHKAISASTTAKGHVQLNNTVTSTSTTQAATANAVKIVNDALTSHKAAAAPHSGHETPAGAQAKADAAEEAAKEYADGIVGNPQNLSTTNKTNIVNAVNELFTNVSNGKAIIASAITDMGQSALGSDTFSTLSTKIKDISKDADATVDDVLAGKTFYQGGVKRSGTMPNRGSIGTQTITTQNGEYTIPEGYHNGLGKVKATFANLIASNVKSGVNIGGVVGSLTPLLSASGSGVITENPAGYPGMSVITGLTFTPKVIVVTITSGSKIGFKLIYCAWLSTSNIIRNSSNTYSWTDHVMTYPSYVNSTGFNLPTLAGNGESFSWEAYG